MPKKRKPYNCLKVSKINAKRLENKMNGRPSSFDGPDVTHDEYKLLAYPNNIVYVNDLYNVYNHVCLTKGITPLSKIEIEAYLNKINFIDHTGRTKSIINQTCIIDYVESQSVPAKVNIINRDKFNRINFITTTYNHYNAIKTPLWFYHGKKQIRNSICSSNISILLIVLELIELLIILQVILSKYKLYTPYLLVARIGAVIILFNSSLLLIHISNIIKYIDHHLVHKISTNSFGLAHRVLGIKIFIGSITHIIGHYLHVNNVLNVCKFGCTYNDVLTIPKDTKFPIKISWSYFNNQLAYYTGIILISILSVIELGVIFQKYNLIRSSTLYNVHRTLAVIFFIIMIIHGTERLLGFNLSYIFILPTLLLFIASRYMEIFYCNKLEIDNWYITDSIIRLSFINSPYMIKQLEYGIAVSAYINHPITSLLEWHPFTISSGLDINKSYVSIANSGKWTNRLIDNITINANSQITQYINLGHVIPSCFRFYKFYINKIFFCSGIGITPFLSIINQPNEYKNNNLLIWSIGNMEIINQFANILREIHLKPNLQIYIFYSNTSKQLNQPITRPQLHKFNFLQTLIHYKSGVDIVHGIQIPLIIILERINSLNIISHNISTIKNANNPVGIFVCGSSRYNHSIRESVNLLKFNPKKIKIDLWIEDL